MKNFYYKLLVSSIYTAQNNGIMSSVWKFLSNYYIAFGISCNLLMVFILINNHFFPNILDVFVIPFLFQRKFNFLINFILYFIIPIMVINHVLIYKDNKYKKIILRYKESYNKKLFAYYFIPSFLIPIVYVLFQVEIRI